MRALSAHARQFFVDHFGTEMGQVEQDMVLVLADTAAFADFDRHRARHDIARGKILVMRRVAFHETLAIRVTQNAAFAAHAFSDQTTRAVDAGRVELHELHILQGESRTRKQSAAIARAGMCRGRREIGATVAAGGEHDAMRAKQV